MNALETYTTQQARIKHLLKQINGALLEHDRACSQEPGGHHWGAVGDLDCIVSRLQEAKDFLARAGEYAA